MSKVDIKGIDKVMLFRCLFRCAEVADTVQYSKRRLFNVTIQRLLESNKMVTDICGKKLYINLNDDMFDTTLYNKYNGENSAEWIINKIKELNMTHIHDDTVVRLYRKSKEDEIMQSLIQTTSITEDMQIVLGKSLKELDIAMKENFNNIIVKNIREFYMSKDIPKKLICKGTILENKDEIKSFLKATNYMRSKCHIVLKDYNPYCWLNSKDDILEILPEDEYISIIGLTTAFGYVYIDNIVSITIESDCKIWIEC
jgi:hypothetical protein